jgi:hypothetical protein
VAEVGQEKRVAGHLPAAQRMRVVGVGERPAVGLAERRHEVLPVEVDVVGEGRAVPLLPVGVQLHVARDDEAVEADVEREGVSGHPAAGAELDFDVAVAGQDVAVAVPSERVRRDAEVAERRRRDRGRRSLADLLLRHFDRRLIGVGRGRRRGGRGGRGRRGGLGRSEAGGPGVAGGCAKERDEQRGCDKEGWSQAIVLRAQRAAHGVFADHG